MFRAIRLGIIACALACLAGHATAEMKGDVPFKDEISRIASGLEYSGYEVLIRPDVALHIDFETKTWTLTNTHAYDAKGGIALVGGRYGLCAELSTYLYEQLKPSLNDGYSVRFANVSESDFFSRSQSNHVVLLLKEEASQNVYLLDPSFNKYGRIGDFPEYTVMRIQDSLSFTRDRTADISFQADQAMPLRVRQDVLLSFAVTSVDGKFDKNNFFFVIAFNNRYETKPVDIVVLGKRNGVVEEVRRAQLLEQLLKAGEFLELYRKMNIWLQRL